VSDFHARRENPEDLAAGIDGWLGGATIGKIDTTSKILLRIVAEPLHHGIKARASPTLELRFNAPVVGRDVVNLAVALDERNVRTSAGDAIDFVKKLTQ
jgi:hypothetical protein